MRSFILAFSIAAIPALLEAQAEQPAHPVVVAQPPTKLPLQHTPQPTTSAITAADLMTRLYIFADDSMMGREAGTIGNVKGTDYIAGEVKRLGLVPAGENGSYFQTLPFKNREMESGSRITMGATSLAAGTEWALALGTTLPTGTLPVVWGGTIGDGSPRIAPEKAAGKMVVYRVLPTGMAALQDP